ncbi:RIO1 [Ecytonucleospora hepatopenaei]|uniref:non-specific serine/threonine protein kinase n=1 Tax=Ecytonucleospora hepatopenaei TaxID=646526 RepID=A0A1W0E7C0_9MICR|nr:RIO1 [Ecytonucleospora hepatopenaei]
MKENKTERKIKDSSMFATTDKVLDHTSKGILDSLKRRNKLHSVEQAIATGKEAAIFPGIIDKNIETKFINAVKEETDSIVDVKPQTFVKCAIKIYKTSTMFFKDRTKYIKNEKRYSNICTTNSRKLIKVWAEKEVRNLKRIRKAGILAPCPLYLKKSVLIMEMVMKEDKVSQILKNYKKITQKTYDDTLQIIDDMYNKAKLVHGDLSEYNILIGDNENLYVIDVGQSVDLTHENALYFLIIDIININIFYKNKNVLLYDENTIFEKITNLKIPNCLKGIKLNKNSFIPTNLSEVVNEEDAYLFLEDKNVNLENTSESREEFNIHNKYTISVDSYDSSKSITDDNDETTNKVCLESLHKNVIKHKHKKEIKEANRERRKLKALKKKIKQ